MIAVLIRRGKLDTEAHIKVEVKMKKEIRVVHLQAKDQHSASKPLEAGGEAWHVLLHGPQQELALPTP